MSISRSMDGKVAKSEASFLFCLTIIKSNTYVCIFIESKITYFMDFLSKFIGMLEKQIYHEVHLKKAGFGKVWLPAASNKNKSLLTLVKSICTTSTWGFEICDFLILHCPNSEISSLTWLFEISKIFAVQCKSSIFDLPFVRCKISWFIICDF